MISGKVKLWNSERGFGFLRCDDGEADVFVHVSEVQRACIDAIAVGDSVEFMVQRQPDGRERATDLRAICAGAPSRQSVTRTGAYR
jgi:CspA family cold shock protein